MQAINRNVNTFKDKNFDAIIIGGGIYGVMLSLIGAQKGLKTLLLEKDDFGGATSYNSLRIIHGGFRYLQKLDLKRFFESVSERKWFLKNFPDLVSPIACLMPLYGKGIYRNSILRSALIINDFLSVHRNKGLSEKSYLSRGKIISSETVKEIFPDVLQLGLTGGALWYDASMPDSQRVLIESLKWSCSMGATALNYFEVTSILKDGDNIKGVEANDKYSAKSYNFSSKIVINAAGPWTRELSKNFDKDYPELFRTSIAWNILFNKKALSDHALAITPDKPDAKTYFLRPWKQMLFAGTVHEPWSGIEANPMPMENSINSFIHDLNCSIKNLNLKREDVLQIYSGLLPAYEEGSEKLAVREVILDHSKSGGPQGLFSVSGVKFTTARLVAEKVLNLIFPDKNTRFFDRQIFTDNYSFNFGWNPDELDKSTQEYLISIINTESVIHIDDLIIRRTSIGDNPLRAMKISKHISKLFDWDKGRCEEELQRLKKYFNQKNQI